MSSSQLVTLVLSTILFNWGLGKSRPPSPPIHCQLIRAGEIEVIAGDASRYRGHPGIWSLTSKRRNFNIFNNESAGLLAADFRNKRNTVLEYADDSPRALKRR